MKKLYYLLICAFLITTTLTKAQDNQVSQKLEKNILNQISQDSKDKIGSFNIFTLKVVTGYNEISAKLSNIDSIQSKFSPNCYLRFYLTCFGDSNNAGVLKCYRRSDSSTIPDILLKEIKCSGNETKIITFDYKTTDDEAFNFYLVLENNRKAIAVATLTQYFQKEKN